MRQGRRTRTEQIVLTLSQIETWMAQGKSIAVACKKVGISEQIYYRWRREYGGLKVDTTKTTGDPWHQIAQLRRVVVDLLLENQVLADTVSGNLSALKRRRQTIDA